MSLNLNTRKIRAPYANLIVECPVPNGVFKLIADAKTSRLLGAHIVAENAGEVIYTATLAVKFGLTVEDLKGTMAPYLTMAEGLKLAALTFDKDVSKLSCCAG